MDLDTIHQDLEELKRIVSQISSNQERDHELLMEHDKILVRGNGVPSLQETVRTLAKTVQDYIDESKAEKKRKEDEVSRWKWLLIGIGVPAILTFTGQAAVFWIRIAPMLEQLKAP